MVFRLSSFWFGSVLGRYRDRDIGFGVLVYGFNVEDGSLTISLDGWTNVGRIMIKQDIEFHG